MTEQPLKGQQIDTRFQQVGCERVTQAMDTASVGQARPFHRIRKGPFDRPAGQGTIREQRAREEPVLGVVERQ